MGKFTSFVTGAILGGIIGGSAAMLLAPGSGGELRDRIREEVQDIINAGRRAAEDRRDELEETLDNLRQNQPSD
jgi:gas vesicle protein